MKRFLISFCTVMLSVAAFAQTEEYRQIQNGGFEDWGVDANVSSSKAAEPRYWHSFTSASGDYAGMAGDHCFRSTDAHSGNYSAMVKATKISFVVFSVVANGTMTTGRLHAGAMSASDAKNHSEVDMSKEDLDRNEDTFYQRLEARPDSIVFWVKYSTGKAGTTANMSAFITDGTYYQAPEDKAYTNKVGWAENPNIAPCTEWTRISVPFTYAENNLAPKAIMLTFSTSAIPGGGKGDEVLLVDDVELIYKSAAEEAGISYTDDLVVKVDTEEGTNSTTLPNSTINILKKDDGTYKLSVKNFVLGPGMELGDVTADNLIGSTEGDLTVIKMENVPVTIGNPMFAAGLPDLKINLDAKFNADKLYALIDIDLKSVLGQMVNVIFGSPFTESGISHVSAESHERVDGIHTLGGQRVSRAATPGVYIVNGKKVMRK